jgi:hypothetical protein
MCTCDQENKDRKIADLERELAKYKLTWLTGIPPEDGDYLFRYSPDSLTVAKYLSSEGKFWVDDEYWYKDEMVEWAGPIRTRGGEMLGSMQEQTLNEYESELATLKQEIDDLKKAARQNAEEHTSILQEPSTSLEASQEKVKRLVEGLMGIVNLSYDDACDHAQEYARKLLEELK